MKRTRLSVVAGALLMLAATWTLSGQSPAGTPVTIPQGTEVTITQSLGGSYTVMGPGVMARIQAKDADALGIENKKSQAETKSEPKASPSAAKKKGK
jgi:hypothetical protein